MNKKEYITKLGEFLTDNKKTMSVPELAEHLNRNNFKTNYGSDFQGKRGTYTLVDAVYDELVDAGNKLKADKVSAAFPKNDGTYAY